MAEQVRRGYTKKQTKKETEQATSLPSPAAKTKEQREADAAELDTLLDEIDEVLEENAVEFVKGYVQKGGQ